MNKKKASVSLVVSLAVIMVILYLVGFVLSQSVFRGNEIYKDTPIPALPYIFLFDSAYHDQLAAERLQAEALETEDTAPVEVEIIYETESDAELDTAEAVSAEEIPEDPVKVHYVRGAVGADYFADALFIGDSRTDGLSLYSAFDGADYFASKGMTVFSVFETTARDGKTKLEELLSENTYGKIYIMLGINEIGTNFDMVITQYAVVVDKLKELAPDAIIVIQASLSISEEKSNTTWYLTAERIHELNKLQSALADGERVFYIDANEIFCDEDGYLKTELSGDGVHLYAKDYAAWSAWMCENAFVPETVPDT